MRFEGYKRGVNFGGWLSQCDHTKRRYDTFITEDGVHPTGDGSAAYAQLLLKTVVNIMK